MMKVKIKERSWLAAVAATRLKATRMALVLGSTIHLHGVSIKDFLNNRRWLLHELKHVEQYREHGLIAFLYRYLVETLKNGYYNNRFEIEARLAETDKDLLSKHDISRYMK